MQEAYLNQFKFFCSNLELDGIYIKNFPELIQNNTFELNSFISKIDNIKEETALLPVFVLIADYYVDNSIYDIFDFLRVSLNVTDIFESIRNKNFNYYDINTRINQEKKIVWSLNSWEKASNQSLRKMFLFLYSLPGFSMIDQNMKFNQTCIDFIKEFNDVIKPKLNDFKKERQEQKSAKKYRLRGPEPFRGSSESLVREYLDEDLNYQLTIVFKSVLLVKRQINNYHA